MCDCPGLGRMPTPRTISHGQSRPKHRLRVRKRRFARGNQVSVFKGRGHGCGASICAYATRHPHTTNHTLITV